VTSTSPAAESRGRPNNGRNGLEEITVMKDLLEVLRMKEQQLSRVKEEVEALRIVARLLGEDESTEDDREEDTRRVVEMP
jgi:hypothetical protein